MPRVSRMAALREVQVTFDCADPPRVARFWCEALGYELDDDVVDGLHWAACADPTGKGPRLFFQKVPEGKTVKNRLHLDIRASDRSAPPEQRDAAVRAEVERLESAGATRVELREETGTHFMVMQDVEGNEFCVT